MQPRNGYTVTELMVAVTILGIAAVASVPNITSYLRSRNAATATEQVGAHLRVARSRAVLEGNDYVVQFTGANTYQVVDDDGGGNGIPGAAGYDVTNRSNGQADAGELVMGPFTLPQDIAFATVAGIQNPFTGTELDAPITFGEVNGTRAVVFHSNGTADEGGYVALAPQTDVGADSARRTRVLQLTASTGSVQSRAAGR